MIKNKTIFIAHNWSDASLNQQSKALAYAFAKNNKVVFLSAKKGGFHNTVINDNMTVFEWPGKRPTGFKDLFFAYKMMKRYKPDIVISNFAANDFMLFVSWLLHVPVRMAYYHTMVEQYIADHGKLGLSQHISIARKGWAFRRATHILASSTRSAKDLQKYYGVSNKALRIFPNALPKPPKKNAGQGQHIGFLGRLHKSKGVDLLVQAFISIANKVPHTNLIIAGSGNEEANLKQALAEANLSSRVQWLGQIGYTEIFDFLVQLNHLVVPSRTDNLPTVVLEAFSTATPVIGSNSGGIPDMIQSGYNGFLFEPENVEDLAPKMLELITNIDARNKMAINAQETFEAKYSIETLPERFEKLIEESSLI